jgi:acyl-coenzyme A thioesterase PaaI-like protein
MTGEPPIDTYGDFGANSYDQVCFACGDRNHHGLHMRFERAEGGVICRYTPREADQGFPGTMHGGIISTLLDEAMAWALWSHVRALGVTAKMETRYRRPVTSDAPLVVRGRVATERGRRYELEASVEDLHGNVLVDATALFLRLLPEEEAVVVRRIGWLRD